MSIFAKSMIETGLPQWLSGKGSMQKSIVQKSVETQIRSLGREDPLEEGMATHSSIFAWGIPWTEEPGGLQYIGSQRVGHDWSNLALTCACTYIRMCIYTYISSSHTLVSSSQTYVYFHLIPFFRILLFQNVEYLIPPYLPGLSSVVISSDKIPTE